MDIDVANNIKAVELLKVELLENIANLYGEIAAEPSCDTSANLASHAADIIIITKILCRRLGVDAELINNEMRNKLICEIQNEHILERRFGDLSLILSEIGEENICNEKY